MARTSLPPGFRFHPTDVELIMYYLKRKILGKKLHAKAIADINIYKFSPWDLPDKSCLRSKDLEWFFFCPRERKYASGARVKRATENGYWKTTGKDRSISYDDKAVGTVKTLIFHLGHAPRGERTDWVIHEYKILDDQLADSGIQDSYVLCKLFKKNGLGPKNGAQYGAPFKEEEWTDDETDDAQEIANTSSTPVGQPPRGLLSEKLTEVSTSLFGPGNTSEVCLIDEHPSPSAGTTTGGVQFNLSDDEMDRLLAPFIADNMFPLNENGNAKGDGNGNLASTSVPFLGGNDIFGSLQDLHNYAPVGRQLGFSGTLNDVYSEMLPEGDFIELNDLQALNYCHESNDIFGSFSNENPPNLFSGIGSSGTGQYTSCESQLPMLPIGSHKENFGLNVLQEVNNHQLYQSSECSYSQLPLLVNGCNKQNYSLDALQMVNNNNQFCPETSAAYHSGFSQSQPEVGESSFSIFNQDRERGRFDDTW